MTHAGLRQAFVALRGVFFSSAFVLLWLWLALVVRRFDPALGVALPGWLWPLGLVLSFLGGLLAASCITVFITHGRGTPAPFDPPREFVAAGPYRYVRNPMYLGAIGVLLGSALMVGSVAIVLLAIGFWVFTESLVLLYEEPALEERFGPAYLEYKSRVYRWVPRIPQRPEGS
jgi:protein-S-isoprenylcysteine O-methyltransferase Ste14